MFRCHKCCGWLVKWTRIIGGEATKEVRVPKIDLQSRAPLINFIFFLRTIFLMWVGGWVGGSGGGSQAVIPPPSPPGNGEPWPGRGLFRFLNEVCWELLRVVGDGGF